MSKTDKLVTLIMGVAVLTALTLQLSHVLTFLFTNNC